MTYTALRLDDSVTTCDCCGRTDLKATVLMQSDEGALVNFGQVCAGRNSNKDRRQLKKEMAKAYDVRVGSASNALRFSDEARTLRAYRLAAPWETIGWAAYEASPQVLAFAALKQRLATEFHVPLSAF
jgi:hypothetical protein